MPKKRFLIIPMLLVIGLFLAINGLNRPQPGGRGSTPSLAVGYRAWAEGITTVAYDETGAVDYTLQAPRQLVYDDNSSQLEQPFIRLYNENDRQWNITADSGRISARHGTAPSPARHIELLGNVQIFSVDEFGHRAVLNTQQLLIDPAAETAETSLPVTLNTTNILHSATGLYVDMQSERMIFLSDNQGNYATGEQR